MGQNLDIHTPFHRRDALSAGLTDNDLRGNRFQTVFRGVHLAASITVNQTHRLLAALALVQSTEAHLSHASAARLHGMPIPPLADEHVTVPRAEARRRTAGVRCHLAPGGSVIRLRGMRVSSAPRTFVELATVLELVDLVVVGDAMVRKRLCTLEELRAFVASTRLRGARAAAAAVAYVREEVDSPMETRLRMLLVLAGLPEPRINLKIRAGDGRVVRRYDLSYPEIRVIVEYDGRQHVEIIENWEADLKRREAIEDDRWRILVVVASGIFSEPEETVRRVWRVLRARELSGVPRRPSDAWRPHFPGRH